MDETPFGRYRLLSMLGRGGMGEVWRAFDTGTERVVALKMLPPQFSDDATFQERFRREALAAAGLKSPHVITIYDYGDIDGRLFVSMELVEGRDLHAVITDGPMQPDRAVRIVEQVAKALHSAHKVGLIHRDVKPSNVLLGEDDFAYLIDFGIALAADDTRMTGLGDTVGTLHYIAPERLGELGDNDARVDIYALACVLYECLTGEPPFAGTSVAGLLNAHLHTPPPQLSSKRPDVPAALGDVIVTGMAKGPNDRYPTTLELATAAQHAITTHAKPVMTEPSEPDSAAMEFAFTRPPAPAPATEVAPAVAQSPTPPPIAVDPAAATSLASPAAAAVAAAAPPWWRRRPAIVAAAIVTVVVIGFGGIVLSNDDTTQAKAPSEAPPPPPPTIETITAFNGQPIESLAVDADNAVYAAGFDGVQKLAGTFGSPVGLPFPKLISPRVAVGVDHAVYVTNPSQKVVLKLAPGATTPVPLPFTTVGLPTGVAVGTDNSVYVTGFFNDEVLKLAPGATTPVSLPLSNLDRPSAVSVDTDGAVYVADRGNNRVLKLAPGATTPVSLSFPDLNGPSSVAVGNDRAVYVTDTGNTRVLKLAADAATPVVLPFTGLKEPAGVAVGPDNAVYVSDTGNTRVLKLAP